MQRSDHHWAREAQILREKMRRWDERNWAELTMSALAGDRLNEEQTNHVSEVTESVHFKAELKAIHARRDEECRAHLEQTAFRPEKMYMAKMAHKLSDRRSAGVTGITRSSSSTTPRGPRTARTSANARP